MTSRCFAVTLSAFLCALSIPVYAQDVEPPAPSGAPKLEVIPPTVDLGRISNTTAAVASFVVRNTGNADLQIEQVKTSCGCTLAEPAASVVKAGEETSVKVTVDPQKIHGFAVAKSVSVVSNDPSQPTIPVPINGTIEPEYIVEPEKIEFGTMGKGESAEQTLLFKVAGDVPVKLDSVDLVEPMEGIDIVTEEVPEAERATPGRAEYRVTVRLRPDAPAGNRTQQLAFQTDCKRVPRHHVPLSVNIVSPYSVRPNMITLASAAPGQSRPNAVMISAATPLEIKNVSSESEAFGFNVHYGPDKKSAYIDLNVLTDAKGQIVNTPIRFDIVTDGKSFSESVMVRGAIREDAPDPRMTPSQSPTQPLGPGPSQPE